MPSHSWIVLEGPGCLLMLGRSRGSRMPSHCWAVLEGPGCLLFAGSF